MLPNGFSTMPIEDDMQSSRNQNEKTRPAHQMVTSLKRQLSRRALLAAHLFSLFSIRYLSSVDEFFQGVARASCVETAADDEVLKYFRFGVNVVGTFGNAREYRRRQPFLRPLWL